MTADQGSAMGTSVFLGVQVFPKAQTLGKARASLEAPTAGHTVGSAPAATSRKTSSPRMQQKRSPESYSSS